MRKLKKGDRVLVTTGRDRGRSGVIEKIFSNGRAIVRDVNIVKKHQKPNPNQGVSGGIVPMEAPIHMSNLALINPETNKKDRVGFGFDDKGKKIRIFKSNGQAV